MRRERQSKERGVLTHDLADRRDWTRTQSLLQPPKGRRGAVGRATSSAGASCQISTPIKNHQRHREFTGDGVANSAKIAFFVLVVHLIGLGLMMLCCCIQL